MRWEKKFEKNKEKKNMFTLGIFFQRHKQKKCEKKS